MTPNTEIPSRRSTALAALLLALLAAVAYWPAPGNDFVPFDDVIYVLENPPVRQGLSWDSVVWAFSTFHGGNWHPLTWLSHMADASIYGLDPFGHHLSGVLLHVLNTVLLFLALRSLSGAFWRCFAVSLLFGLHPLHVESVAWISERKDVLCASFWFLALWAYAHYSHGPSWRRYLPVALAFALGLMAKSMIVTLPLLLLVLDFWPLGRLRSLRSFGRLVLEKLPLLAMTLAISLATVLAQRQYGAVNTWDVLPLDMRVYNALRAYLSYLGKTFWPENLAILYPFPEEIVFWRAALYAAALLGISIACLLLARRKPYLLTGWLWYLGTLAPVIGILQVGIQSMADRYTYVPLVGVGIMLAWGAQDLLGRARWGRVALAGVLVCATAAMLPLTWKQVAVWKNGETLLGHAVAVVPNHHEARYNLGGILYTKGDYAGAAQELEGYVRHNPGNAKAVEMLLDSLLRLQEYGRALPFLKLALQHQPEDARLLTMMGYASYHSGAFEQAIAAFRKSLSLAPEPRTRVLLGLSLLQQGHPDQAQPLLQQGLQSEDNARMRASLATIVRGELQRLAAALQERGDQAASRRVRDLLASLPL